MNFRQYKGYVHLMKYKGYMSTQKDYCSNLPIFDSHIKLYVYLIPDIRFTNCKVQRLNQACMFVLYLSRVLNILQYKQKQAYTHETWTLNHTNVTSQHRREIAVNITSRNDQTPCKPFFNMNENGVVYNEKDL